MLNRIDKDIIRILLKYLDKYLTTNQIALKVKISPLTAKRHLGSLKKEGYVKSKVGGKIREYERKWEGIPLQKNRTPTGTMSLMRMENFSKTITAPAKILWALRYKNK